MLELVANNTRKPSLFEKMFEGYNIRMFNLNNEIYFVGKDVALTLGYSNTRDAVSNHCDDKIQLSEILEGSKTATP